MIMELEYIIRGKDLRKNFKGFELEIDDLKIPKGFATALIGENGAGKTTLLNMMSGIRLDFKGEFTYFEKENNIDADQVKERIGYTGPNNFFLPHWTIQQVREICKLLFDNFDEKKFDSICDALCIPVGNAKNVKSLSDGNRMKLMLATVLARTTDLLILDEPASPLDPLMRDKLCEIIRQYISNGEGERSVFFSTHNIADMESVTDYAIIMEKGKVVEEGFVEDLKEKYILVKGETEDYVKASKVLIGSSKSNYGFEGLCLSDKLDQLAGINVAYETPTLSQICVGIMKEYTSLKMDL
ncbi:MAG: ABC transporter ATP-binding protein [Clostridiales bacterium]|nr:ABC transporter ATP-binding protein [Clostridiales bacterium]